MPMHKRVYKRNFSLTIFLCIIDKASAIEKRIQKSRRLIILLTHQLLNCKEFAYDQHVALYNALIQNNTKVILLEMERMETYETLQESLKYIIKKQGTVKWKEQHTVHPQSSNSKFWKRVRYLMPLRLRPSYSVNAGWTFCLRKL